MYLDEVKSMALRSENVKYSHNQTALYILIVIVTELLYYHFLLLLIKEKKNIKKPVWLRSIKPCF